MNREHKYRVWDRLLKKMIYPDTITFDSFGRLHHIEFTGTNDSMLSASMDLLKMEDGSDRFIPEQFTGLLDKNGKVYWDGCLVKGIKCGLVDNTEDSIGKVYYNIHHAAYWVISVEGKYNVPVGNANWWEVIGTIHDEEELPKE